MTPELLPAGVQWSGDVYVDGQLHAEHGQLCSMPWLRGLGPVRLRLGEVGVLDETGQPAEWVLNQDGHSPHLGVFGKAGKGKTRLAKTLLQQVTAHGVPVLVIDPKGDLREDSESMFRRIRGRGPTADSFPTTLRGQG